jgi:hypothetical protein
MDFPHNLMHWWQSYDGFGLRNYQVIDSTLLLIELLLINGAGVGLYFFGNQA